MRFSFETRYWHDYRYHAVFFMQSGRPTRIKLGVVDDFGDLQPIERRRATSERDLIENQKPRGVLRR